MNSIFQMEENGKYLGTIDRLAWIVTFFGIWEKYYVCIYKLKKQMKMRNVIGVIGLKPLHFFSLFLLIIWLHRKKIQFVCASYNFMIGINK